MKTIEFKNTLIKYKLTPSGCYQCLSHKASKRNGYCFYSPHRGQKRKIVHILAEKLDVKKPEGATTMNCGNKWCVNPQHLIHYKRRSESDKDFSPLYRKKGEESHTAKLTQQQVLQIRKSRINSLELSKQYGVSRSQIRKIQQNESWKHISKRISTKPKREPKNSHKSVYRFDYPKNNGKPSKGWKVRFVWKGKCYQKDFSDYRWKTKKKALKAAIAWRDQTEAEVGKPRVDIPVNLNQRPSNTGYTGIRKTYYRYRNNGYWYGYNCYEARWKHEGKGHCSRYSIDKYGDEEALNKAIARRQLAEIEMYGITLQEMTS